ncbi:unnamed protein product [Soboliphyme baturini]|uniref:Ion_trans domain-containing protein n=1 Tax=Soboliphyme baturini TaxID=241478 RepID=A0A183J5G8_9BILA|nr:unnamed protein product [Soboliphyme baturini]
MDKEDGDDQTSVNVSLPVPLLDDSTNWHYYVEETVDKSRRRKFKNLLLEFCDSTTAHGIPRIGSADSRKAGTFWTVVCVICFVLVVFQSILIITKFLRFDTTTQIEDFRCGYLPNVGEMADWTVWLVRSVCGQPFDVDLLRGHYFQYASFPLDLCCSSDYGFHPVIECYCLTLSISIDGLRHSGILVLQAMDLRRIIK